MKANLPPKPVSPNIRPEITRLPSITFWRKFARGLWRIIARFLFWLFARVDITGLENVPPTGGVLFVTNHLGDPDFLIGVAYSPRSLEVLAKSELYDIPILGSLMEAYGVIWLHRGQPDRRALRAALRGLAEGRAIAIAPEGRESLSGSLEEGANGAAYLALKADVPILPITCTGTENKRLLEHLKRLRRTPMKVTIGKPFYLQKSDSLRADLERGTQTVMSTLAAQLPPEYRGVYRNEVEEL